MYWMSPPSRGRTSASKKAISGASRILAARSRGMPIRRAIRMAWWGPFSGTIRPRKAR